MNQPLRIAVVGLWHLGETYSACLAELGHTVVGISEDGALVEGFKRNIPPLAEPGLAELLERHQKTGRLSYVSDFKAVEGADVLWLAHDVPVDEGDESDLSPVWGALASAIPHLKEGVTVAVSSQVPVGTSKEIIARIRERRPGLSFGYFYSPENLRLGEAVKSFMEQERVVVGADDVRGREHSKRAFAPLAAEIMAMGTASAEMAKHAVNAWLATSISFANDLADACERAGADVEDVIRSLKAEPRVGPKAYLFAGLGFSGGTLGRDVRSLLALARREGVELPVISGAYAKNRLRAAMVRARLERRFGSLEGRTFAVFGVTYKPGTPTLRRSQPLEIEAGLRAAGARVRLFDPLALSEEVAGRTPSFFTCDPYEAARGAEAALVLSPDRSLRDLDFARLAAAMKTPIIFDAQNVLVSKEEDIRRAGFAYWSVGR